MTVEVKDRCVYGEAPARMPSKQGDLQRGYSQESLVGERYMTGQGRIETNPELREEYDGYKSEY